MPSKKKIVHLLHVLGDTMEIDPRELASAALEYASSVLNDPNEAGKNDEYENGSPSFDGPEHATATKAPVKTYAGPLHLCLDFGTAVSKAFAWDKESDTPLPLKIGTAAGEPASSPYGLSSTIFIARNGNVYFGQAAINHAAAVTDPERHRPLESIKDILSVGQKEGLTELTHSDFNPSPFPVTRKQVIALYLGFLTDSALTALRDDYGEESRNIPRVYTKPVFDRHRDDWATKTLAECAELGQVLADRFSGQWTYGISLEVLGNVFSEATALPNLSNVVSGFLPEPVAAFASRIRNYSPESQNRRLMMVIDVGAGTTDFAMFAAFESEDKMNLVRISNSVKTIRIGGDTVDNVLLGFLLEKAGVTSEDTRYGAIRADLQREIRLIKEDLFKTDAIERTLVNDITVTIQLKEFEECDRMKQLQDAMFAKFRDVLSDIDISWLSFREVHIFFTGGGSSLKLMTALGSDQEMTIQGRTVRPRAVNNIPNWIAAESEENLRLLSAACRLYWRSRVRRCGNYSFDRGERSAGIPRRRPECAMEDGGISRRNLRGRHYSTGSTRAGTTTLDAARPRFSTPGDLICTRRAIDAPSGRRKA